MLLDQGRAVDLVSPPPRAGAGGASEGNPEPLPYTYVLAESVATVATVATAQVRGVIPVAIGPPVATPEWLPARR